MVRTKKHFRPPSPASSSSSSSEGEDDANDYDHQIMVQRGRGKQMGNFGRGKQFSMAPPPVPAGGRGKQLRAPEPESEEEESSDDSSSDDDDDDDDEEQQAVVPPPDSRGKQLRPPSPQQQPVPVQRGRGKQLRAPSPPPQQQQEEEDSDSSESVAPAYHPPSTYQPSPAVIQRGVGKHFGRSMGKQLPSQPPPGQEEDSDSSSSEDEPFAARPRGGKQLIRAPPAPAKDESDMEESSSDEDEEEEEEEEVKREEEPDPEPPKTAPTPAKKPKPKKPSDPEPEPEIEMEQEPEPEEPVKADESEESEFELDEPAPTPSRRGRPPRAAAAKADKSARATAKKEISSEEEEMPDHEEASDSSSSDESSSDEEQEWDMETFDMQKLVKGDEDQRYLDSLTELDRENILAERFEKLKQEADMKKALRENKRKEREQREARKKKPAKKRSASKAKKTVTPARKKKKVDSESESEEGEGAPDTSADVALAQSLAGKRVSTRNLDKKGKQFKKQAALQKIRENRANRAAEADESGSDYGVDSDDDSDDDYEEEVRPWQQRDRKRSSAVSDEESREGVEDDGEQEPSQGQRRLEDIGAELEDYIKVSIPRRRLIQWCNEPFFEQAVKDFYVRVGIGRDNKTQKAFYRLCRITGIVRKSEYSFPQVENQKSVSTDKWLKVSFGKFEREFKMITVSEHRPSLDDVTKLVSQLRTERQTESLLTKKSANKLRKSQDELVNNYTYTKEDIEVLVKERKKRNKKALNIGLEKTRIAIAVQAARDEVEEAKRLLEDAKVERMEADDDVAAIAESRVTKAKEGLDSAMEKLEAKLEEQQKIQKEDQDRINRLKQSSKVQNWAKVNQRAKMANRNADFQSYKEQQAREKSQGSTEPKFDPYARRRVKPKNLWEVGDKASGGGGEEEKKETLPTERDDTNVGNVNGDKDDNKRDDYETQKLELPGQQAANQLVFDDDIMIGGDVANLGIGAKKKVGTRVRRGISLEEYQQRKASGTL